MDATSLTLYDYQGKISESQKTFFKTEKLDKTTMKKVALILLNIMRINFNLNIMRIKLLII